MRRKKTTGQKSVAISSRRGAGMSRVGGVFFFSIFFLFGAGFFYFFFIQPVTKIWEAETWPELACTVISSEVKSHSDSDGTTYSIDIKYRYEINGREFKADRYDFMGGSSSGYDSKQEIIDNYPPGTTVPCYVNPTDPHDAVLFRGYSWIMLVGLFPLIFIIVGLGGMYFSIRPAKLTSTSRALATGSEPKSGFGYRSSTTPLQTSTLSSMNQPVTLKPSASPVARFVGSIFIACFWNGIVSIFLWQCVQSWNSGSPDYFLALILIPFVFVGIALVGVMVYAFLGIFNPRVTLTLSSAAIPLDKRAQVSWQFSGNVARIKRLTIYIEGQEEATYRRGTDTITDRHTFKRINIHTEDHFTAIRQGSASFQMPRDTMHTFNGDANKIIWKLHFRGEIAHWPDVTEDYVIEVLPLSEIAYGDS